MKPKFICLSIFPALLFCSFLSLTKFAVNKAQQDNHPPVVKITAPQNNSAFDPTAAVAYKITVSDKEDGESKFDEINVKEVLLKVRYLKAGMKISKELRGDAPGLAVMRTSNCFNCHNFNSKSIGPSFLDISKRYPPTKSNIDSLIKRIRLGSSGIWESREKMPAHPELTADQVKNTVQWILKNAANPDITYYIGTEGLFRVDAAKKGAYMLTASYVDHGIKTNPASAHLKGQDVVIIIPKK